MGKRSADFLMQGALGHLLISIRKALPYILLIIYIPVVIKLWSNDGERRNQHEVWKKEAIQERPVIIVITPTHIRKTRLADMTRFSQTLSHIKDLHWIVVEDGNHTVNAVERILQRSGLPYVYLATTTDPGFPKRGWTHRNRALVYIRANYADYKRKTVVYFGDDDNTYDIRLFNNYIRKVDKLGFWAVGLSGTALVEAPHVENGTIVAWDTVYAPNRAYATDMAGFAFGLQELIRTNASFSIGCTGTVPEPCFIRQFGIPKEKAQPFGWNEDPKEILVWHTQTKDAAGLGERHGYVIE